MLMFYVKYPSTVSFLISSLSTLTVILQKSFNTPPEQKPSLSPNFPSRLKGLGGFNCIRLKVNPRSLEFAPHWRCKKCLTDIDTMGTQSQKEWKRHEISSISVDKTWKMHTKIWSINDFVEVERSDPMMLLSLNPLKPPTSISYHCGLMVNC